MRMPAQRVNNGCCARQVPSRRAALVIAHGIRHTPASTECGELPELLSQSELGVSQSELGVSQSVAGGCQSVAGGCQRGDLKSVPGVSMHAAQAWCLQKGRVRIMLHPAGRALHEHSKRSLEHALWGHNRGACSAQECSTGACTARVLQWCLGARV